MMPRCLIIGVCLLTFAAASIVSASEERFDIDHATNQFELAMQDRENLSLEHYVEGFKELKKFVSEIGFLFKLVENDLNVKIMTLDNMIKNPSRNAAAESAYSSIRSAIEFEVRRNLVKDHRGPAVTRILSRLQWALEFMSAFVLRLSKLRYNQDTSYIAREAYNKSLARHHSWPVRLIVALTLRSLPDKRGIIETVVGKQYGLSEDVIDSKIAKLGHVTSDLWRLVEKIYADNNLFNVAS